MRLSETDVQKCQPCAKTEQLLYCVAIVVAATIGILAPTAMKASMVEATMTILL